jgi:phosphoglycolate phosphatase
MSTQPANQPPQSAIPPEPRVSVRAGFEWDGQGAYLFDIDGTLLRSRDRVHVNAFTSCVQRVTGFEVTLAGISMQGSTDTAILREAWRQAGIADELLEPQAEAILQAMCSVVAERRHEMQLVRMPGVEETLRHLASRGALLGIATGNLEAIGWIKVEEIGLREWFRFGGFCDRYPDRRELIGKAAEKARELAGTDARICVVGDTPRDIDAARANDLTVIAVATGRYTFDELQQSEPDACTTSLADLLAQTRNAP